MFPRRPATFLIHPSIGRDEGAHEGWAVLARAEISPHPIRGLPNACAKGVRAGGERVAAGVVERSPRGRRPEDVVVGESGDEQPDATPTSARLDEVGALPERITCL